MRILLAMFVLTFSYAVVAESNPPSPSAAPDGGNKQSHTKNGNDKGADKQNQAAPAPISIVVSPTIGAQEHTQPQSGNGNDKAHEDRWLEIIFIGITALATGVVAVFTWRLADSTNRLWDEAKIAGEIGRDNAAAALKNADAASRAATLSQKAMSLGSRAFIGIDFILHELRPDPADRTKLRYRFNFKWVNTGNTPTRNMQTHVAFYSSDQEMPANFNFANHPNDTATCLVPPHSTIGSPLTPPRGVSAEDMVSNFEGRKFMYMWGWARYRDVFDDTPEHITRFCFQILANGSPMNPGEDGHGVDFTYPFAPQHNCADEECGRT